MEGTIGEIRYFAANFAPKDWAYCAGQLIPISSNTALFSILGTTYGGDGKTTFALPDFRNIVVLGTGNAAWGSYELGEMSGNSIVQLGFNNMPMHSHSFTGTVSVHCTAAAGNADTPQNTFPATFADTGEMYSTANNASLMAPMQQDIQLGNTGQSTPFTIDQPVLGLAAVVCMRGLFPVRN
jgi:microcystin-dependent protein